MTVAAMVSEVAATIWCDLHRPSPPRFKFVAHPQTLRHNMVTPTSIALESTDITGQVLRALAFPIEKAAWRIQPSRPSQDDRARVRDSGRITGVSVLVHHYLMQLACQECRHGGRPRGHGVRGWGNAVQYAPIRVAEIDRTPSHPGRHRPCPGEFFRVQTDEPWRVPR